MPRGAGHCRAWCRNQRFRGLMSACCASRHAGSRGWRAGARCCEKEAPGHARTACPLPMPARPAPIPLFCVPAIAAPVFPHAHAATCRGRPLKKFQQPKQSEKGPRWVKDKAVFWCKLCNTDFSVVVRKHHCRHCGHVFCGFFLALLACAGTLGCCRRRTASASAGRIQPAEPVCQSTLANEVTHGGGEQTLLFQ